MKTLGRIILFIVGGVLIGFSIYAMIGDIKYLNSVGWNLTQDGVMPYFVGFLTCCLNCLVGASAFFSSLKGRASFFLLLFAACMIAFTIWYFIELGKAGYLGDFLSVMKGILNIILPILYGLGTILICFPIGKSS